jgi:hypothetical protein
MPSLLTEIPAATRGCHADGCGWSLEFGIYLRSFRVRNTGRRTHAVRTYRVRVLRRDFHLQQRRGLVGRLAFTLERCRAPTLSKSMDTKSTIAGGETRQEPNTVLDFLNPGRDWGPSSFDARHNLVLTSTYPLPFLFQQKAVGMILEGWTVNGIGTFRTGEPFSVRVGSNLLNQAHFYLPGFNAFSGSAGHITRLVSSPGGRLTQLALKVVF